MIDLSGVGRCGRDTRFSLNIEQLLQGCPKLRVLRFDLNLNLAFDPETFRYVLLDNASMERILKNAYKLRSLDVRGCTSITNSNLVRVPTLDLVLHLF